MHDDVMLHTAVSTGICCWYREVVSGAYAVKNRHSTGHGSSMACDPRHQSIGLFGEPMAMSVAMSIVVTLILLLWHRVQIALVRRGLFEQLHKTREEPWASH
jgi:hypothetical protein